MYPYYHTFFTWGNKLQPRLSAAAMELHSPQPHPGPSSAVEKVAGCGYSPAFASQSGACAQALCASQLHCCRCCSRRRRCRGRRRTRWTWDWSSREWRCNLVSSRARHFSKNLDISHFLHALTEIGLVVFQVLLLQLLCL